MRAVHHESAAEFFEAAASFLERTEAENNLLLAIAEMVSRRPEQFEGAFFATVVGRRGEVTAASVRTPPWGPIITAASDAEIAALLDVLVPVTRDIPSVLGPSEAAAAFARMWSERTASCSQLGMGMRSFRLDRVVTPPGVGPGGRVVPGQLRRFRDDQLGLLVRWVEAFMRDSHIQNHQDPSADALRRLEDGDAYYWDDGGPVSMVARTGRTPHGARVSYVYTPDEHRGRGYASVCVAALSRRLLDQGARFCFLFTDAANPTSNAIYQRIGYRHMDDYQEYLFGR